MTTIIQEVIQLNVAFDNVPIRKCTMDDQPCVSVLDIIGALTYTEAKGVWRTIRTQFPELKKATKSFRFTGSRDTPVANADVILEIIFKIPGAKAREFSATAAQTFIKTLNPTHEFISELEDRAHALERRDVDARIGVFETLNNENTFSIVPRCHVDTSLYIRMRLPDEYLCESTYGKQLTIDIFKFGITYSVNGRNAQYMKDKDNGYMVFSFHCSSRKEATIVEDILKLNLSSATVLGSREYVDVSAVAKLLGCDYEPGSYTSYANVAQHLYAYMLKFVHFIWPTNSHMYGHYYEIVSDNATLVRNTEDDSVKVHSELSFRCNVIDKKLATVFQLTPESCQGVEIVPEVEVPDTPEVASSSSSTSENDVVVENTIVEVDIPRPEPIIEQPRSNLVISRDRNGKEDVYIHSTRASQETLVGQQSFSRKYLNKGRLLDNKHWRNAGRQYWTPTQEVQHDPNVVETLSDVKIQTISAEGVVKIYESERSAERMMRLSATDRKVLKDAIRSNLSFAGVTWSTVRDPDVWGSWFDDTTDVATLVVRNRDSEPGLVAQRTDTGHNGRCSGKIIGQDLTTGIETVYDSIHHAASRFKVHDGTISSRVDKPHQINGCGLRSFTADTRWTPLNLRPDSDVAKVDSRFIVKLDKNGVILDMYQSATSAAKLSGVDRSDIMKFVSQDELSSWRFATHEEIWNFTPIV